MTANVTSIGEPGGRTSIHSGSPGRSDRPPIFLADLDAGGDGSAAKEPTFTGTRRYVRRQRSWFRRDHRIHWFDGADPGALDAVLTLWRHVS